MLVQFTSVLTSTIVSTAAPTLVDELHPGGRRPSPLHAGNPATLYLGRRPQDRFLAGQVSLRVEHRRPVEPGESDLEGVLPFESTAFGMKKMAEEELERTALNTHADL